MASSSSCSTQDLNSHIHTATLVAFGLLIALVMKALTKYYASLEPFEWNKGSSISLVLVIFARVITCFMFVGVLMETFVKVFCPNIRVMLYVWGVCVVIIVGVASAVCIPWKKWCSKREKNTEEEQSTPLLPVQQQSANTERSFKALFDEANKGWFSRTFMRATRSGGVERTYVPVDTKKTDEHAGGQSAGQSSGGGDEEKNEISGGQSAGQSSGGGDEEKNEISGGQSAGQSSGGGDEEKKDEIDLAKSKRKGIMIPGSERGGIKLKPP